MALADRVITPRVRAAYQEQVSIAEAVTAVANARASLAESKQQEAEEKAKVLEAERDALIASLKNMNIQVQRVDCSGSGNQINIINNTYFATMTPDEASTAASTTEPLFSTRPVDATAVPSVNQGLLMTLLYPLSESSAPSVKGHGQEQHDS
jgi:hypothetical protein